MKYVALLRGINVGGNCRVPMAQLKALFEKLGHTDVSTYINTGNVIFSSSSDMQKLKVEIENQIHAEFGFQVPVLVYSQAEFTKIASAIPAAWKNDESEKSDVLFLWQEIDSPEVIQKLGLTSFEEGQYLPGTVIWRVLREHQAASGMNKIVGTALYKKMTIRNVNTVREIASGLG